MHVRTGLPLFHTTRLGRIVEWNLAAEELSGILASDAVGQDCWQVIRGRDAEGGLVCHRACSVVRLAREGWPMRCTDLHVRMPSGLERVSISTIVVGGASDVAVLHPMQSVVDEATAPADAPGLTRRQEEVLALLAEGVRPKEIAQQLSLSVATVRNHVHALLRRLGVRSQLEAAAKGRALGLGRSASERRRR